MFEIDHPQRKKKHLGMGETFKEWGDIMVFFWPKKH